MLILNANSHASSIASGKRAAAPSAGSESAPADTFIASAPATPAPFYKKALNSGVMGVAMGAAGAAAAATLASAAVSAPEALSAAVLAAAVGAPIGVALGGVVGWKNAAAEHLGGGRKALNMAGWAAAGAGVGATAVVSVVAAATSGPDALGALVFAPVGAIVGGLLGAGLGGKTLR